jgi:hypothetical protein
VKFDPAQCGSSLEGSKLADTGCPADLIGLNDMTVGDVERIEAAAEPICFSTANGPVWAGSTLPLQGVSLLEEINPYVMEQTPAVLSIGRRCMLHGYSFHWPASKSPYFVKPDGEKIVCDVHSYVPYIRHREPTWSERAAAAPATATLSGNAALRRPRFNDAGDSAGGGHAPALPGSSLSPVPPPSPVDTTSSEDGEERTPDTGRKAIPNTLAEAKSLRHLLTHLPKNDHCEACVRAKMVEKHARRRSNPTGP